MAIGAKNNNSGKNVFYVKMVKSDKAKNRVPPHFSFRHKEADDTYSEVQNASFSGSLTSVKTEDHEYQGQITPQAVLRIEDGNDVYILSLLYNFTSRSLLNSLLSLTEFPTKVLNFNVYETKKNEKGETYPAFAIWQGDTMVKWFYQKDELPAIEKIAIKGKKDLTDSSKLDDFLRAKLDDKFNGKNSPAKEETGAPFDEEVNKDSVPF